MNFPDPLPVVAGVSAVAVALAWLATLALRRKSAALRHFLWLLALAAPLVALPLAWLPGSIALPLLPPAVASSPAPMAAFPSGPSLSLSLSAPADVAPAPSTADTSAISTPRFSWRCNPWVAVWILGAAVVSLRILISRLRAKLILRAGCSPAPENLVHQLDRVQSSFSFVHSIRLLVTPLTGVPFCHGIARPAVVFPESWTEWDQERVGICFAHELAHVARRDLLAMLIAQAACVACWFNPLVWFAAARLRDEAENAADDFVLTGGIRPETYATHLVALTEKYHASALAPTIALSMARPNRLKSRIEAILDPALARKAPRRRTAFALGLLAAMVLVAGLFVRLTAAPPTLGADAGNFKITGANLALEKPLPDKHAWAVPYQVALTAPKQDLAQMGDRKRIAVWQTAFYAMRNGDIATIESLLQRGLDPNADLVGSSSLLFVAVDDGQLPIVQLLLDHGAKVEIKTSWGESLFGRACRKGNRPIADALITAGIKVDPVCYAGGMGDLDNLIALDQKQPFTDKVALNVLDTTVTAGRLNTFNWLWEKFAPKDPAAKTKLLGDLYVKAASWGQPVMLPRLEQLGADRAALGPRALEGAIGENSPPAVKYLLEAGVSPNVVPPHYLKSTLRDPAGEGYLEVVKLLLDHGADINAQDTQGFTPLAWAAYSGKDDVCVLLLERGADPNITDFEGENAAWRAAGGPHCPQALELMIKKGVKIDGIDKQGQTILSAMMRFSTPEDGGIGFPGVLYSDATLQAYRERERRVVELLTNAGVSLSGQPGAETPLMTALEDHHFEAARELIQKGVDFSVKDKYGNTALGYLFKWARNDGVPLDILKTFLDRGLDPNGDLYIMGMQPPMGAPLLEEAIAIASNHYVDGASFAQAVKIMLDHGARFPKVTDDKVQSLLQAAARGDLATVQASIEQGTPINAANGDGWTALAISVALGYEDNANWLLAQGAGTKSPTQPIGLWANLLAFAAGRGNADLVEKLLARGVDANDGMSLFWAIKQNNQRIFDDLIRAGAKPDNHATVTVSSPGHSPTTPPDAVPLYICIQNGNLAMAQTLLEKGESPNPPNLTGNRGLVYWAVSYDRPDILKLLLDHGADSTTKDDFGQTPLTLAQKSHPDLVPILKAARR